MPDVNGKFVLVMAGGGTGGHFYPAMAIAAALEREFSARYPDKVLEIHFIGSRQGIESRLIERYSYPHLLVNVKGVRRSLKPADLMHNILFLMKLATSFLKVRRYIRDISPAAVIGTGSYSSGLPLFCASRAGIPYYIQEQNAWPGMVNRRFSAGASAFFYAYKNVLSHLKETDNTVYSGNPVRKDLKPVDRKTAASVYGLDPGRTTIFIFGGSQGSRAINRSVVHFVPIMMRRWPVQVIWQTGEENFEEIKKAIPESRSLILRPFIHDMENAYSASDLIISRAGALTLAELQVMKKAALLVPLPGAAANHQLHNARALEQTGSVLVIEEKELPAGSLFNALQMLLDTPDKLKKMRTAMEGQSLPDTLSIIANRIIGDLTVD